MADWQEDQLSRRRFAHRSVKHGKGRAGHGETFQPRNMLGRYILSSAFFERLAKSTPGGKDEKEMWLEIHELVDSETGYLASFDLGTVTGVMLIAGSRKGLAAVVEEANEAQEADDTLDDRLVEQVSPRELSDGEAPEDADEDDVDDSSFLAAPESDRPGHAFEKNTFRTPKWFAQWRGRVVVAADSQQVGESEDAAHAFCSTHADNKAHLEFSSGACRDFKATFTCPSLGAREVAMQGRKVTGKSAPATLRWTDIDQSELRQPELDVR